MSHWQEHDRIVIQGFRTRAIIGIDAHERDRRQEIILGITLYTDLRTAGASDDIQHALNYKSVVDLVRHFIEQSHFNLIEKLAAEVSTLLFAHFSFDRLRLSIDKPSAISGVESVGLVITRDRKQHS